MARIADSSVLYALFDGNDAHHAEAREAFEDDEEVLIPSEILVETIDLMAYRSGYPSAAKALEALLGLPQVNVAGQVPIKGVQEVHRTAKGRLSLADAIVVQTCRLLGARPLTFDRALLRAAKS